MKILIASNLFNASYYLIYLFNLFNVKCTHILISFCMYHFSEIFEISVVAIVNDVKLYVKLSIQVRWKFRKEINLRVLSLTTRRTGVYIDSFIECAHSAVIQCHSTQAETYSK